MDILLNMKMEIYVISILSLNIPVKPSIFVIQVYGKEGQYLLMFHSMKMQM